MKPPVPGDYVHTTMLQETVQQTLRDLKKRHRGVSVGKMIELVYDAVLKYADAVSVTAGSSSRSQVLTVKVSQWLGDKRVKANHRPGRGISVTSVMTVPPEHAAVPMFGQEFNFSHE